MVPQVMDTIVNAIRVIRLPAAARESDLHAAIASALTGAGVAYRHEQPLGPGDRPDFITAGGVAIEAKIKANRPALLRQLTRYSQYDSIIGIVVVLGRNASAGGHLEVPGCAIHTITLSHERGIAI